VLPLYTRNESHLAVYFGGRTPGSVLKRYPVFYPTLPLHNRTTPTRLPEKLKGFEHDHMPSPRGGGTAYSGLYGEAPPERAAFFKLAVYKRVGKIAILVYERVTKSAAKWKKWPLKRSTSKGATFWQK